MKVEFLSFFRGIFEGVSSRPAISLQNVSFGFFYGIERPNLIWDSSQSRLTTMFSLSVVFLWDVSELVYEIIR
jgi:hypothetical protein